MLKKNPAESSYLDISFQGLLAALDVMVTRRSIENFTKNFPSVEQWLANRHTVYLSDEGMTKIVLYQNDAGTIELRVLCSEREEYVDKIKENWRAAAPIRDLIKYILTRTNQGIPVRYRSNSRFGYDDMFS